MYIRWIFSSNKIYFINKLFVMEINSNFLFKNPSDWYLQIINDIANLLYANHLEIENVIWWSHMMKSRWRKFSNVCLNFIMINVHSRWCLAVEFLIISPKSVTRFLHFALIFNRFLDVLNLFKAIIFFRLIIGAYPHCFAYRCLKIEFNTYMFYIISI